MEKEGIFDLSGVMEGIRPGPPAAAGTVTVFPLLRGADPAGGNGLGPEAGEPGELLLDESILAGRVTVTERGRGSVPEIVVTNDGDRPVLILEGDHLVGARQNRVVWVTILIAPGTKIVVPVTCMEQGRWSFRGEKFAASRHRATPRMKRAASIDLEAALERGVGFLVNQGRVWDDVRELACFASVDSPTKAFEDVMHSGEGRLDRLLDRFARSPGQRGVLVLRGGLLAGIELAGSARTWEKIHERAIAPYLFDAAAGGSDPDLAACLRTGRAPVPEGPRPEQGEAELLVASEWLRRLGACSCRTRPSVGVGRDLRIESDSLIGGGLEHDGRLVFLTAYDRSGREAGR